MIQRPGPQLEVAGKKLFRVEVEERRTAVFYVLTDDLKAARAEAEELGQAIDGEWDDVENDVYVSAATSDPSLHQVVWVGSEKGGFLEWNEINHG